MVSSFLPLIFHLTDIGVPVIMILSLFLPQLNWSTYKHFYKYDSYAEQVRGLRMDFNLAPFHINNEMSNGEDVPFYEETTYTFCNRWGTLFMYQKPEHYCLLLNVTRITSLIALSFSILSLLYSVCRNKTKMNIDVSLSLRANLNIIVGISGLFAIHSWYFLQKELNRDYNMHYENLEPVKLDYCYGFYLFFAISLLACSDAFFCVIRGLILSDIEEERQTTKEYKEKINENLQNQEFKEGDFTENRV